MKRIACVALCGFVALAGISCRGKHGALRPEHPKWPLMFANSPKPTKEQVANGRKTADAVDEFAFHLARETARQRPGGGFLVSPLSVATCHAMLLSGATGMTRKDLAAALALGDPEPEAVDDGMFALAYQVTHTDSRELQIANAFFPVGPLKINRAFQNVLRQSYDADTIQLDGVGPDSLAKVNGWVDDKTAGMIPKVLDHIDDQAVYLLANAATFDGAWDTPFDEGDTRDAPFTLSSGANVQVPTMRLDEVDVGWCAQNGFAAVVIPYRARNFTFVVLLPDRASNPSKVLSRLTRARWTTLLKDASYDEAKLSLPRFRFDGSYDLIPTMSSLGARRLFHDAELGGISDQASNASVGQDVHATHIEVDERGTRAAAATELDTKTDTTSPNPKDIKIDRPFLYAIVHKQTGTIVFLGVCMDPRQTR